MEYKTKREFNYKGRKYQAGQFIPISDIDEAKVLERYNKIEKIKKQRSSKAKK